MGLLCQNFNTWVLFWEFGIFNYLVQMRPKQAFLHHKQLALVAEYCCGAVDKPFKTYSVDLHRWAHVFQKLA
jgi:hypothetical protein